MCISPITLKREIQSIDGSHTHSVPCGKCPECLRSRANTWAFRLKEEMKKSSSAVMATFTYTDEKQPLSFNGIPTLDKVHFQAFLKRLRKTLPKHISIKYYACGEYGEQTERPHYHAIMFNLTPKYLNNPENLANHWQKGHVHLLPCNTSTINYTLKYLMKGTFQPTDELDDRDKPFALMSKKMGLDYLTPQMIHYIKTDQKAHITLEGGIKNAMPRYFKQKLYTQSERAQIAKRTQKQQDENPKFRNAQHEHSYKEALIRKTIKENRNRTDKNL